MTNTTTLEPLLKEDGITINHNDSVLGNRTILHKVKGHGFASGCHHILVQDRYGNGPFFMDWAPVANREGYRPKDWNVLIEVK